nr:hypothetical protein [Streptomyces violens]
MNQLQTPKASRNQETGRESFMPSSMSGGFVRPLSGAASCGVTVAAPDTAGTFTVVPTISPSLAPSPARRRTAHRAAAAALVCAALTAPLAVAAPAYADDAKPTKSKAPAPPATMSAVGGGPLAKPGTQVRLKDGAPKLPKGLSARSWIVSDPESGDVLAAHNAHWPLPPASTLKMLFADTLLPKFPKTEQHKVAPEDLAGMGEGSSLVGIKENQTYSVHDLWLGVFLRSGNDAVHTLAAMNHGVEQTVRDMQAHADELNAHDTHVVTPDGYDAKGQVSSAYDLSLFARSGLQNADFREYASTAFAQFPGEAKKGKKRPTFGIQNTNRLLTGAFGMKPYKGIAGVKNGNTTNAGSTFTGVAQRGDKVLLVTVMNPAKKDLNEVYKETAALFDWGFAARDKVEPVGRLVGPKSEEGDAAKHSAGQQHGKPGAAHLSATEGDGERGGASTALGIAGGALVVLGGVAFAVHRRWPLPELVRRRGR